MEKLWLTLYINSGKQYLYCLKVIFCHKQNFTKSTIKGIKRNKSKKSTIYSKHPCCTPEVGEALYLCWACALPSNFSSSGRTQSIIEHFFTSWHYNIFNKIFLKKMWQRDIFWDLTKPKFYVIRFIKICTKTCGCVKEYRWTRSQGRPRPSLWRTTRSHI